MQRTLRIVVALLLIAALAALVVPVALPRVTVSDHGGRHGKMGATGAPDELYNVVGITGTTGTSASFDILSTTVKGKGGKVITMAPSAPRSGTYYFANDTAVIPIGARPQRQQGDHKKPAMTDYNNATLNVSGASAVVAWKNVTMTGTGKGDRGMQFTDLVTYLPGGTGKSYKLSTPVRITKSADNTSVLIVGNPELRAALQDILKSGAKFPASTAPVKLQAIDAIK